MLDNIIVFGLAFIYMLAVAAFALVCVHVARWLTTKLEEMIG